MHVLYLAQKGVKTLPVLRHLRASVVIAIPSMVLPRPALALDSFSTWTSLVCDGIIFLGRVWLALLGVFLNFFKASKGCKIQPPAYRNHTGPNYLGNFNSIL